MTVSELKGLIKKVENSDSVKELRDVLLVLLEELKYEAQKVEDELYSD